MKNRQGEDVRKERKGMHIPTGIGEETQIRNAIIDRNARIGKNVMVRKDNTLKAFPKPHSFLLCFTHFFLPAVKSASLAFPLL